MRRVCTHEDVGRNCCGRLLHTDQGSRPTNCRAGGILVLWLGKRGRPDGQKAKRQLLGCAGAEVGSTLLPISVTPMCSRRRAKFRRPCHSTTVLVTHSTTNCAARTNANCEQVTDHSSRQCQGSSPGTVSAVMFGLIGEANYRLTCGV
jgi:hypothetical protein